MNGNSEHGAPKMKSSKLWQLCVKYLVGLMMLFAGPIGRFVSDHPTIKMLALSFLVVVGVVLVAEGFDHHVPKGYVYFAMAFSLGVEVLNIRMRKRSAKPVKLHAPHIPGD